MPARQRQRRQGVRLRPLAQVRPLGQGLAQARRRELLQASLRSMNDAMVRYESLAAARAGLLSC